MPLRAAFPPDPRGGRRAALSIAQSRLPAAQPPELHWDQPRQEAADVRCVGHAAPAAASPQVAQAVDHLEHEPQPYHAPAFRKALRERFPDLLGEGAAEAAEGAAG
jgi:hypothetical protein